MSEETALTTEKRVKIFVQLLDEGTVVYRPTNAMDLGNGRFRLEACSGYSPDDETWEFLPGTEVRREVRTLASGKQYVAVSV
jgi:hypothetical protein